MKVYVGQIPFFDDENGELIGFRQIIFEVRPTPEKFLELARERFTEPQHQGLFDEMAKGRFHNFLLAIEVEVIPKEQCV